MFRIGTSGWVYKHWKGIFYPEHLPEREWLEYYAEHFDTAEINFSFYRLPKRSTFESWNRRVPKNFRYAVKGSRFITHVKRLQDPKPSIELLLGRLEGLGERAGPLLWQLPPDFDRDDERLAGFLAVLPDSYKHTIEFRHESWLVEDVFRALEAHSVALCIPDSPQLPKAIRLTTDWTYLRFHSGANGGDYTDDQLDSWAEELQKFERQGIDVWAYFNNDWGGYALKNARALKERLGIGSQSVGTSG